MNPYEMITELISGLPQVSEWPEMQAILSRAASNKPRYWRLPVIACEAAGGTMEQALPAMAAVACLQISILLIDDMLDTDPRGEYHRYGMPATANLAAAFQAAGLEAIVQSKVDASTQLATLLCLNQMVLSTALGQHIDTQNPTDEAGYWHLVRTKSSPFFGAALQAGALLGGASKEIADAILRFGYLYGEMIQIHDDLNDCMAVPANPDWLLGRSPLPILFAQTVEHPDKMRFLDVRQRIPDPQALAEAQAILLQCGAVSYVIDQLVRRYRKAREMLESMNLVRRDGVDGLLDDVIDPVRELFSGSSNDPLELLPPPIIAR